MCDIDILCNHLLWRNIAQTETSYLEYDNELKLLNEVSICYFFLKR